MVNLSGAGMKKKKDVTAEGNFPGVDRNPKTAGQLLLVFLTVFFGMSAYQGLKYFTRPDMTLLQSNAITVFFGSLVATVAAYFLQRKHRRLQQETMYQLTCRQEAEKALREAFKDLEWMVEERTVALSVLNRRLFVELSERRQVEDNLAEAEEWFRSLFNWSQDVIFITSPDLTILDANDSALDLVGASKKDVMGIGLSELSACLKAPFFAYYCQDMPAGVNNRAEIEIIKKNGAMIWIEFLSRKINIQGRNYFHTVGRDVTERKQTEQALRESERRFSLFMEHLPGMAYIKDISGRLIYVNHVYAKKCGKGGEALIGRLEKRYWPLETIDRLVEQDRIVYEEKRPRIYVDELDMSDGPGFWLTNKFPIFQDDGPTLIGGISIEITDRVKMEKALQESEETARAFLNATPDAVVIVNSSKYILTLNEQFAYRYHRNPFSLIGSPLADLFKQSRKAAEVRLGAVDQVFQTGESCRMLDWLDGLMLENAYYPLFDENGKVEKVVLYSRDVTDQVRSHKELQEYQTQLRSLAAQLSMVEERERRRLAEMLHDDITQNLAYCLSRLRELLEDWNDKEVKNILGQVAVLLEETNRDIKSLTLKLSPPILYDLGLVPAIEVMAEETEEQSGIRISFDYEEEILDMDHDLRMVLYRSVRELLVNGVKHSRATEIAIACRLENGNIVISVEDNGVGFDARKLTVWRKGQEGFGLFSIRERLKHAGGEFILKTAPGQGAKCILKAPLAVGDRNRERGAGENQDISS